MTPCLIAYLCAAEALAYFATALSWLAAWRRPEPQQLSRAAFATGLCFLLKAFRVSLGIVAGA